MPEATESPFTGRVGTLSMRESHRATMQVRSAAISISVMPQTRCFIQNQALLRQRGHGLGGGNPFFRTMTLFSPTISIAAGQVASRSYVALIFWPTVMVVALAAVLGIALGLTAYAGTRLGLGAIFGGGIILYECFFLARWFCKRGDEPR
jgi:hypothetical protein